MKPLRFLPVLLVILLLAGCNGAVRTDVGETWSVTDDYGRKVSVPKVPKRIVSTSPAITEIIFALGADSLLVGRTDFCTYPDGAAAIPSIGGISNLNVESIAALHPDLVISGSMVSANITHTLEQLGIPVVCVLEKKKFEGLYDNISRIGALCGHKVQADSLNSLLQEHLNSLTSLNSQSSSLNHPPTLYYVVGFGSAGNFTAGGDTYINDILTLAGGSNIAAGITRWSFSLENLMEADPDYILIRHEDSADFCRSHPYKNLSAVRQHRIIALESGTIDLQVPRNLQAIQTIAQHISQP